MTRSGSFLVALLALLGTVAASAGAAPPPETPDLILVNGKVLTVDARDSIVQAVVAKGDRILKAGTNAEIRALAGPKTHVLDLRGKTVTPGIIDSHAHVLYYGRQFWPGFLDIRFPAVRSKEDLLAAVARKAASIPRGEWISGNQGFHLQEEGSLDRSDLDRVAPANPVYLRHSSGQHAVVNTLALKLAGIDRSTRDPFGGKIVRDPRTGEPTGVLLHYPAENLVARVAAGYGERTDQELEQDLERGQEICLSTGITSAQDVIVGTLRDVQAHQRLAARNALRMRIYILFYIGSEEQARRAAGAVQAIRSDMLTLASWKLAIDGGIAAGTAHMYGKSLFAARNAYPYYEPDTLKSIVGILHETGMQISFHAVGDRGIDEARRSGCMLAGLRA